MSRAPLRVALGPLELAGTARALADGLNQAGHRARVLVWSRHGFGYREDGLIEGRRQRVRFAWRAPLDFDVLHGQGGRTWFSYVDFAYARSRGVTCVIQYNGSDVRDSDLARRLHPGRARIVNPDLDRVVRRHRRLGGRVAHAAVVQDLELATYLLAHYRTIYVMPFAIDLVAIDAARGKPSARGPADGALRVLHAPSSRRIKGSDEIEAIVRSLAEAEPVHLTTISGEPHSGVLAAAAQADVVVDQLNADVPGVFPAEAMALGRPVLCEFDPRKLAPFARRTPVIGVTGATLATALTELARDPARRAELGRAGREYALSVHAPSVAAAAAERVYRHARGAQPGVFEATAEGIRPLDLQAELPELSGAERPPHRVN